MAKNFDVDRALGSGRSWPCCAPPTRLAQRQFASMAACFERHGGLKTQGALARELSLRFGLPRPRPPAGIFARSVVHVQWQDETLLPMFQFDRDLSIRPVVSGVIDELRAPFDDWELAMWFAQPNLWLGGATPVALVPSDEKAVLGAARADRFIALG